MPNVKDAQKKYKGESYFDLLTDKQKILDDFTEGEKRFQKFSERTEQCAIPPEAFEPLSEGKYMTEWKGIPMIKATMDMVVYQQLLWEVKPPTIIEFGTAYGASSLWMSDIMAAYGVKCDIYTLDISPDLCDKRAKSAPNVHFVIGDSNKVEEAYTAELLESLPHPWVVIEDAHINVVGVLEHLHNFTKRGDYVIVEDTNPYGKAKLVAGYTAPGYKGVGEAKLNQVKEFMESHDDDYVVDAKMQDMFGTNGSWNMNSTLLRI